MLDIKLLRNNFEEVEKALSTRNEDFDLSKFKSMDEKRRQLLAEVEQLKNRQNVESKKNSSDEKSRGRYCSGDGRDEEAFRKH